MSNDKTKSYEMAVKIGRFIAQLAETKVLEMVDMLAILDSLSVNSENGGEKMWDKMLAHKELLHEFMDIMADLNSLGIHPSRIKENIKKIREENKQPAPEPEP